MDRFYEAFLDEGYSTVHELLQLTEGEFHMLLKEVSAFVTKLIECCSFLWINNVCFYVN